MNIETLHRYCTEKKGVTETFPFDEDTLVFKVLGKIFALTSLASWEEGLARINLKCEPEKAIQLRQEHSAILPGFHMNKKHWNTVFLENTLPDSFIKEMIDHSYKMVVKSLPKKYQKELDIL